MENNKVLLSVKDLEVKFRVRGRILTAIRGISLDIYENESIAIVGESGSGKSVFTKTFAGMLDENGFIANGSLIFNDDELSDTVVPLNSSALKLIAGTKAKLDQYSKLEAGAETYRAMLDLDKEKELLSNLSEEEKSAISDKLDDLRFKRTEAFNLKLTFDSSKEKDKIKECSEIIRNYDAQIKELEAQRDQRVKEHRESVEHDAGYQKRYSETMASLKEKYAKEITADVPAEKLARNEILAKEIYLSVGRFDYIRRVKNINKLVNALRKAMELGIDLSDEAQLNGVFDNVVFRV